jgi:hypothetical protein
MCDPNNVGHGESCDEELTNFQKNRLLPEGGDIGFDRIEGYGGAVFGYMHAILYKDQVPALRPFDGKEIPNAPWDAVHCEKYSVGNGDDVWGTGNYPRQQEIVDTRTYVDVGNQVVLKNGGVEYKLTKRLNERDNSGSLLHDWYYKLEDTVDFPAVPYGTTFTIETPLGFTDGGDAFGGKLDSPVLESPGLLTVTTPAFVNSEILQIQRNQDMSLAWTDASTKETNAFLLFGNAENQLTHFCLAGSEKAFTIAASVLNDLPATGGWLIVGQARHYIYNYEGRRIDVLSQNCNYRDYTIAN